MERSCISSGGFFFLWPCMWGGGRNEVLRKRTEISKMVLIVCTFFSTHARPLPSPMTPPFYLNHTSNNDFEERNEREAALWCFFSPDSSNCREGALRTCTIQCEIYSQICTMLIIGRGVCVSEQFLLKRQVAAQSAASLNLFKIGITSHSLGLKHRKRLA